MFVLKRNATVPVRPAAFGGTVTFHVHPCTVDQYAALSTLPAVPNAADARDAVIVALQPHVLRIEGLAVERDDGGVREITSVALLLEHCPAWTLAAAYEAVFMASRLTPDELGNFGLPSSIGAKAASSTAPTVDPDD